MSEKKKKKEDLEERLFVAGYIKESVDDIVDRILDGPDKKSRRYATG